MNTAKRKEMQTRRGAVAIVREGGRWPRYRVSYKYGADYWVELVPFTRDGLRALRAFARQVEFMDAAPRVAVSA